MTTNLVNLSNIKVNISKKAFDYSAEVSVGGVILTNSENNTKSVSVGANIDKLIPFNAPATAVFGPIVGNDVVLNWKLKRDKKPSGDSKTYDKTVNIPLSMPSASFSVDLGKIGSITFSADAPSAADIKKKEDEVRRERERIAEQKRQEQEMARAEAERVERERLERERLEREQAEHAERLRVELDKNIAELLKNEGEARLHIEKELEYAATQVQAHHEHVKKLGEEDEQAKRQVMMRSYASFPALHPELRIAKLFQEPLAEDDDPVFAAICAKPSSSSSSRANGLPPAATNSKPDDIYTQTTISPDPYSATRQAAAARASVSPNRGSPAVNSTSHQQQQQMPRLTPLDLLHDKNSDPDRLAAEQKDPYRQQFGASSFETDFGKISTMQQDEIATDDPAYQPPEKLYKMSAEKRQNPLRQLGASGIDDLPPLDSLPRVQRYQTQNVVQQQQQQQDLTSSPRRGVTFSDQPNKDTLFNSPSQQLMFPNSTSASSTSSAMRGRRNSGSNINSILLDKGIGGGDGGINNKTVDKDSVRFEMDLDPPPALMTALLHLSRDGGNLSATIPIEHQSTFFNQSNNNNNNNNSTSPVRGFVAGRAATNSSNNTTRMTTVMTNVSPRDSIPQQNSPSSSPTHQHHHHLRDNSMTPRRKLPLVYTNIGEVVSKTRRHDDRAVPSFMRQKEIRFNSDDAAQSYWNCFAPQKAQNLVGVRMPASAVTAFEEAASVQIAAASPPRRVTGVIPAAPRNCRTSSPPKNTLKVMYDGGESSAHRAHRKW